MDTISIDGAKGEGGGQILRSAIALSCITRKPFEIINIRGSRKTPGLRPQHLTSVRAGAKISNASVLGDNLGSMTVCFSPNQIQSGDFAFDIGTAGAASLLLQTIYLPLCFVNKASTINIIGGTHVPWSPAFHYIQFVWAEILKKIGFKLDLTFKKVGYYPQGGGEFSCNISPPQKINGLHMDEKGKLIKILAISGFTNLPRSIAERQIDQVVYRLGMRYPLETEIVTLPGRGKGTMLGLFVEYENGTAGYTSLGERGKMAEQVAADAIDSTEIHLESDGAIDEFLADQIILPLAFASYESLFSTVKVTNHLLTNAEIISRFIDTKIEITGKIGEPGIVRITPTNLMAAE